MDISRSLHRLGAACQQQQSAVGGLRLFQHAAARARYNVRSTSLYYSSACSVIQVSQNIRLYHSRPRVVSHSIPSVAAKKAAAATTTPPFLQRGQRQGQGSQYLNLDTTTSSFHSSHLVNHTDNTCEPSISNFTMADDRNILPDSFKAVHYDLSLTDLDFSSWTYNGSVTYEMTLSLLTPVLGSIKLMQAPQHHWQHHKAHQGDRPECLGVDTQDRKGRGRVRQGQHFLHHLRLPV